MTPLPLHSGAPNNTLTIINRLHSCSTWQRLNLLGSELSRSFSAFGATFAGFDKFNVGIQSIFVVSWFEAGLPGNHQKQGPKSEIM